MARNHQMPTHGSGALLARVGRYVEKISDRDIDDYDVEELVELANDLRVDHPEDSSSEVAR